MGRLIYADHNATTPIAPRAKEAMVLAIENWGNPSSSHGIGRIAREHLEKARTQVANACGVQPKEVVFTSGGSEANAQCLVGAFLNTPDFRLVSAETEHSSVRDSVCFIEKRGAKVLKARILPSGAVDLDHFRELLREHRPQMVSLMAANNETGVLLPVKSVAELCKEAGALFHCDCVQAFGKMAASEWNCADLISISGHKIYGPKGSGAMIVRGDHKLVALPFGGTQEVKRRGGTQNMIGITGFGAACEDLETSGNFAQLQALRDRFETKLLAELDGTSVNGMEAARAANTSNIRIQGVLSDVLLSILDLAGICVSAGSACSSGSVSPSPVLMAMGLTKEEARECLRFSWGRDTTESDIDTVVGVVAENVRRIRARSSTAKN